MVKKIGKIQYTFYALKKINNYAKHVLTKYLIKIW